MIATAVFSFRQFQPFELWRDLLPWTLALAWAREHFPQRILVADAPGRAMLAGALGLPFTEVLDLPPGPAGCGHVYALAKLQAHLAACDRSGQVYDPRRRGRRPRCDDRGFGRRYDIGKCG